jgi:hypothetical protein
LGVVVTDLGVVVTDLRVVVTDLGVVVTDLRVVVTDLGVVVTDLRVVATVFLSTWTEIFTVIANEVKQSQPLRLLHFGGSLKIFFWL